MMKKDFYNQITIDKKVRFGKPILKGTRIPVDLIVGKIAGGMEIEEVMREYDLTRSQILSALQYAAEVVSSEEIAFA